MVKYYNTYSSIAYPSAALTKGGAADIETFCKIIKEEADAENMKADVVFIQAMLETGYLKFGGDVKISSLISQDLEQPETELQEILLRM